MFGILRLLFSLKLFPILLDIHIYIPNFLIFLYVQCVMFLQLADVMVLCYNGDVILNLWFCIFVYFCTDITHVSASVSFMLLPCCVSGYHLFVVIIGIGLVYPTMTSTGDPDKRQLSLS